MKNNINHPNHYNMLPNGIECIDVVQHFDFVIGNAIKYLWRCQHKQNLLEDLEKAKWYIEYAIEQRKSKSIIDSDSSENNINFFTEMSFSSDGELVVK